MTFKETIEKTIGLFLLTGVIMTCNYIKNSWNINNIDLNNDHKPDIQRIYDKKETETKFFYQGKPCSIDDLLKKGFVPYCSIDGSYDFFEKDNLVIKNYEDHYNLVINKKEYDVIK